MPTCFLRALPSSSIRWHVSSRADRRDWISSNDRSFSSNASFSRSALVCEDRMTLILVKKYFIQRTFISFIYFIELSTRRGTEELDLVWLANDLHHKLWFANYTDVITLTDSSSALTASSELMGTVSSENDDSSWERSSEHFCLYSASSDWVLISYRERLGWFLLYKLLTAKSIHATTILLLPVCTPHY